MIALIKVLYCIGGGTWGVPHEIYKLIWVLALLTMTVGNVLGLLQLNVKRVLAYSSIAHSGYMLVAIAALCGAQGNGDIQNEAIAGVLFYLAAYGITNAAAFGVLMMLPSRDPRPATSAETYEDLAGTGRTHTALGLAMAVACFSLIGLPLTVGFFGKFYLIRPALDGGNYWLVGLTMVNAAISAGYYLRIVGTMFLRSDAPAETSAGSVISAPIRSLPITMAICLSAAGTLLFGTILPATTLLNNRTTAAGRMDEEIPAIQSTQVSPDATSIDLPRNPPIPKLASVR
jgi:NADH-quinone oxidoreductase subunit N